MSCIPTESDQQRVRALLRMVMGASDKRTWILRFEALTKAFFKNLLDMKVFEYFFLLIS